MAYISVLAVLCIFIGATKIYMKPFKVVIEKLYNEFLSTNTFEIPPLSYSLKMWLT